MNAHRDIIELVFMFFLGVGFYLIISIFYKFIKQLENHAEKDNDV